MKDNIIQSVGTIVKKEKLASVETETNCKALILESLLPYPGYHGTTIPDKLEPESLFVVTKKVYTDENIIRSIQKVKKATKVSFDAVPGTIILRNNPVSIIRFKGLPYNLIAEIIVHFIDTGIEFEKKKNVAAYESTIQIRKFFRVTELGDGIFEDMDVKEFFYIQVPIQLPWNKFEEITKSIKYNSGELVFDAAQTSVYNASGIVDFVRIYDKNRNIDNLGSIRKSYLDAIAKL
ncbi:MAG: hypothetical protein QM503_15545 [Bacteroidota bacterium]